MSAPAEAQRIGEVILSALATPVAFNDTQLPASASLGISIFPGDGPSPEALLKLADEDMYRAKADAVRRRLTLPTPLIRSA